jgi:hypothetical protein
MVTSEALHASIEHRLDEIVDLVPDANPLESVLRNVEYLAACAMTYRYPTAAGRIKAAPSREEVAGALAKVDAALRAVAAAHGVDSRGAGTRGATPWIGRGRRDLSGH